LANSCDWAAARLGQPIASSVDASSASDRSGTWHCGPPRAAGAGGPAGNGIPVRPQAPGRHGSTRARIAALDLTEYHIGESARRQGTLPQRPANENSGRQGSSSCRPTIVSGPERFASSCRIRARPTDGRAASPPVPASSAAIFRQFSQARKRSAALEPPRTGPSAASPPRAEDVRGSRPARSTASGPVPGYVAVEGRADRDLDDQACRGRKIGGPCRRSTPRGCRVADSPSKSWTGAEKSR